jgi:hypothetical protein
MNPLEFAPKHEAITMRQIGRVFDGRITVEEVAFRRVQRGMHARSSRAFRKAMIANLIRVLLLKANSFTGARPGVGG